MSETEKNDDSKLNTSNIFDEFEVDEQTKQEIDDIRKDINKNWVYYMNKIWLFFKYINFLFFIVLIIAFSYIFIQKSDSDFVNNKEYLNPICSILSWTNSNSSSNCSSLAISIKNIDKNNDILSKEFLKKTIPIIEESYEIDNVKNSKESIFIIDKSLNKNDPLFILNEFDKIKNDFTWIDKQKIKCSDINIDGNIFEAKCSAFSTLWYDDIPWLNWEKTVNTLNWTSITLASSFINYISENDKINLLDKQKEFNIIPYFWEWNFIYKTDFKLKFEYDHGSNLAL